MNSDISKASVCYGLYDNNEIIGFMAVLHQPNANNSKLKRCSRLVILPDYQGIGLGTKFLNLIAKYYNNIGYDFCIVTSAKNLIYSLKNSDEWIMYGYKRTPKSNGAIDGNRILRNNCYTGRFMYNKKEVIYNAKRR